MCSFILQSRSYLEQPIFFGPNQFRFLFFCDYEEIINDAYVTTNSWGR